MKTIFLAFGAVALATALATPAQAGDAAAGKKLARKCQTCHGLDGMSRLPNAPNIAGQPAVYLDEQLKAFKSGKRVNEMMSVVIKQLSDQDIADLVAWYSSIKVTAKMPSD